MNMSLQHWQLIRHGDVAWLYLSKKESTVNSLDQEVFTELSAILQNIAQDESISGLIIRSAKTTGFIVGADIYTIAALNSVEQIMEFIRQGQTVFDYLAAFNKPTVAVIKGLCLGGGMELALACRYRIAVDHPTTRLGFPEVKLGLHPGWGGTIRLPRLLGSITALKLMLTGRSLSAHAAAKMGLVDAVIAECHVERAASYYAQLSCKKTANFPKLWKHWHDVPWIRAGVATVFQHDLSTKVNPKHYPAPYTMLAHWRRDGVSDKAFIGEAKSLVALALTPTAQNLIHVYFLRERLNKLGRRGPANFKHIHVIGAGTMGGDIAAWCVLQGLRVTLQDREPKYLASALFRAHALFKKRLKEPRAIQIAMDSLLPDTMGYGVRTADLLIEAVFEDLTIKQGIFRQLESQAKPDAILATNTSSIMLEAIQKDLKYPERVVGLHFFNPVNQMLLVEVVQSAVSAPEIMEKALAFVHQINKLPLPVQSSPGFVVNRVLMPYLLHAVLLRDSGMPGVVIDQAALDFGMPMGPLRLMDRVGLDVCLSVAKVLQQALQIPIPESLERMVLHKHLGYKTGRGFYHYKNGKPVVERMPEKYRTSYSHLSDQLIEPMIVEARKCLQENIIADADLLDAGMIFGTGFAPFRGGVLKYAAERTTISHESL